MQEDVVILRGESNEQAKLVVPVDEVQGAKVGDLVEVEISFIANEEEQEQEQEQEDSKE